jgi:hypothetical protein
MTALKIVGLAALIFAVLYVISRCFDSCSQWLARRRETSGARDALEPSPSRIRPAKFGTRFKHS